MRRFHYFRLSFILLFLFLFPIQSTAAEDRELTLLFTHDIHDYFIPVYGKVQDGTLREYGGAARLSTLLKENTNDHSLYVDAGDYSMGTLLQDQYTNAQELRFLGQLGCRVTTFGNHEFDPGGLGTADMLKTAVSSGDPLPALVISNLDFSESLTDTQQAFHNALEDYGAMDYVILETNGIRIAFFGLMGEESISDSPTSGQEWIPYIDAARETVKAIGDQADLIVCLSHSGTNGDGKTGEDFDLLKKVPEIDLVISAHSHTYYPEIIQVGDSYLASCGSYLQFLGRIDLTLTESGFRIDDYRMIPIDETVEEDPDMQKLVDTALENLDEHYLRSYDTAFHEIIARNEYPFSSLDEMYAQAAEYPMGNLIADAYLYEARANGIEDIDVAFVSLGTIRDTLPPGEVTTDTIFRICSLGFSKDLSTGHPLISCYATGKDLRTLVELETSLGPMAAAIRMSYSGLNLTYNPKRIPMDRVTDIRIVRPDGSEEPLEDDRLYRICCNQYAANMIDIIPTLTKGLLHVTARDADGEPVADLSDLALQTKDGKDIKEWVALKDYLASLPKENGVPTLTADHNELMGRREILAQGGPAIFFHPGLATKIVCGTVIVLLLLLFLLFRLIRRIIRKRRIKKAAKA